MAVNYSIGQAFDIIAKGEDVEAIADIARRFPMVAIHCAKLTGVAEVAGPLLGAIPAYVSARKVEKAFKVGASDDVDDTEETEAEPEEEAEKPAPKKRARKAKAEPEPDPAEPEADESEGGKYDGMNAMELFKECKKRGIKAQPKKTAKFYKDLLEKNDAEGASDGEDEDDDWDI